ncbi:MAG: leucine-rich repeat domain-containing protein [Paludibacteraceae bacterium]|nr:leucine-rich repeat domain-containing protein [Paludibacteraceae bacterium]
MKKFLLSLCVALLSCIAFAQQPPRMVYVLLKDGTQVKYLADDIDRISVKYSAVPVEKTGLSFSYDETAMTASVTGVEDWDVTSVEIPSKVFYDGKEYDVTSFGAWAFSSCKSLTSVVIPNSVTEIGRTAFAWCTSLTSIEIPESVTSIGESAFTWCTSLKSIEIPESVNFNRRVCIR